MVWCGKVSSCTSHACRSVARANICCLACASGAAKNPGPINDTAIDAVAHTTDTTDQTPLRDTTNSCWLVCAGGAAKHPGPVNTAIDTAVDAAADTTDQTPLRDSTNSYAHAHSGLSASPNLASPTHSKGLDSDATTATSRSAVARASQPRSCAQVRWASRLVVDLPLASESDLDGWFGFVFQ